MTENILAIGNKIELNKKYSRNMTEADAALTYVSQILDIKDDLMVVAMPMRQGNVVPQEIGAILEAYFYTANGIYKADIKVLKRGKDENVFVMGVIFASELKKFQRRQYYRLPCSIQADFLRMKPEDVLRYMKFRKGPVEEFNEKCIIADLSGGGARLFSSVNMEVGEHVYISFPMMMNIGKKDIEIMGEVVTSLRSIDNDEYYDNRIKFKGASMELRDSIVKYIFEQQRIIRSKERGRNRVKENINN